MLVLFGYKSKKESNPIKKDGDFMGIVSWIATGLVAGWLASIITGNNKKMGAGKNIIAGIIGGLLGGFLMNLFGKYGLTGFNIRSLIVATIGSVILLLIVNAFKRKSNVKE